MTAEDERVSAASEGMTYELNGEEWTVGPKCDDSTGNWVCATHHLAFPNNMARGGHTATGEHVLVWNCHLHGPEVP